MNEPQSPKLDDRHGQQGRGILVGRCGGVRFRTAERPRVLHVGSQSNLPPGLRASAAEHGYEGRHILLAHPGDIVVSEPIEPGYVSYIENLVGGEVMVVSPQQTEGPLTSRILSDQLCLRRLANLIDDPSQWVMAVFNPTRAEQQLAEYLGVALWARPQISEVIGSKSGFRRVAKDWGLPVPKGYVAQSLQEVDAYLRMGQSTCWSQAVLKFNYGIGGCGTWYTKPGQPIDSSMRDDIYKFGYQDGDAIVLEEFVKHDKLLGAHLEVDQSGYWICNVWEIILGENQKSYSGAKTLTLTYDMERRVMKALEKLGEALFRHGARGSFGPDLVVTKEKKLVFLELNARIPATAFPLELMKTSCCDFITVFKVQNVCVSSEKFRLSDLMFELNRRGLLLRRENLVDQQPVAVLPFNTNLVPYGKLSIGLFAKNVEELAKVESDVISIISAT